MTQQFNGDIFYFDMFPPYYDSVYWHEGLGHAFDPEKFEEINEAINQLYKIHIRAVINISQKNMFPEYINPRIIEEVKWACKNEYFLFHLTHEITPKLTERNISYTVASLESALVIYKWLKSIDRHSVLAFLAEELFKRWKAIPPDYIIPLSLRQHNFSYQHFYRF